MTTPRHWTGSIGAVVTPFRKEDLTLHLDALAETVDEISKFSFRAIAVATAVGELHSLSPAEFEQVVQTAVGNSHGKPVIAGTGFNSAIGADLARRAERSGAECLLALPAYAHASTPSASIEYYRRIGAATPLPLIVATPDVDFGPEHIGKLADRVATLEAWMDTTGNGPSLQALMAAGKDRLAWFGGLGDEYLESYQRAGVQAYVSSLANLSPKLAVELADVALAGDLDRLRSMAQRYVEPFFAVATRAQGHDISALKDGMELLGREAGPVRPPLGNLPPEKLAALTSIMDCYRNWGTLSRAK